MASVKTVTSDQGFKNVLLNPNNPLQPGDIVYIYPGTYHQSLTLESGVNVAQSGFSQEFITITAFDPMNPPRIQPRVDIIEQPKLEDRPKVVELIDVNYVVLDGLILDGSSGQT